MFKSYLEFKVLEINISTGLRTGHIIAQQVMAENSSAVSNAGYVDNGLFFGLNGSGKVATPANSVGKLFLHYTEELFTGDTELLKHYGIEYEVDVTIPRLIAVYEGDVFTTDNYVIDGTTGAETWGIDEATGQITKKFATDGVSTLVAGYEFNAKSTTLPDGETAAFEFLVVAAL